MNQVSGQFQQFADPVTIKLQGHSRFQSAFGGGFFRIPDFESAKPINLWKANLHCLSEFIKRYLQEFQGRSNS